MSISNHTVDGLLVESAGDHEGPHAVRAAWGDTFLDAVIAGDYRPKALTPPKYTVIWEASDDGSLFTQSTTVHRSEIEPLPRITGEACEKVCGITYGSAVQVRDYTNLLREGEQKFYQGKLLQAVTAYASEYRAGTDTAYDCGPLLYLVRVENTDDKCNFWCRRDHISALPAIAMSDSSMMPPPKHTGCSDKKRSHEPQGSETEGSSTTTRKAQRRQSVTKQNILTIIDEEGIEIPPAANIEQVDAVMARHEALIQVFDSCKKHKVAFRDIFKFFAQTLPEFHSQLCSRWRQAQKYGMDLQQQYKIDSILASFFQTGPLAACETDHPADSDEWQTDHTWVRLRVMRTFNGVNHIGTVTKWLPSNAAGDQELFHVVHDDGAAG